MPLTAPAALATVNAAPATVAVTLPPPVIEAAPVAVLVTFVVAAEVSVVATPTVLKPVKPVQAIVVSVIPALLTTLAVSTPDTVAPVGIATVALLWMFSVSFPSPPTTASSAVQVVLRVPASETSYALNVSLPAVPVKAAPVSIPVVSGLFDPSLH